MKPSGEGPYLLLTDYGTEGWSIRRFQEVSELLYAITDGGVGFPFVVAKELILEVKE